MLTNIHKQRPAKLRAPRISHDTSPIPSGAPLPSRRTTRSDTLARFRYDAAAVAGSSGGGGGGVDIGGGDGDVVVDIEDVVLDPANAEAGRGRSGKRKRGSVTVVGKRSAMSEDVDVDGQSDSDLSSAPSTTTAPTQPPRRARLPIKRIKSEPIKPETTPAPGPPNWEKIYDRLKHMRISGSARDAPVDTMGCHALAQPEAPPRVRRFQTLIALMLSSQTKDTTNAVVMQGLYASLPAATEGGAVGLNLENVLAVSAERLNELIWAVGFHNNKTKYIKAAAEILRDKYEGDIPDTAEGLMGLPGVGPKMAYLCLSAAWGKIEGIGVDVHVHRITNLWGWHGVGGTKTPEETRARLQAWVPREKWTEINWLLVGFGQMVCFSEKGRRKCGECEVGLAGLCKAADRGKVGEGRRAGGWVKGGDGEWIKGGESGGVKVEYEVNGGEEEMKKEKEEKKEEDEMKVEKKEEKDVKVEKLIVQDMKNVKINGKKEEAEEKKAIKQELDD